MTHERNKILLIIPCFNEEKRLNLEKFAHLESVDFYFVNDCSTDETGTLLQNFVQQFPQHRLLQSMKNVGKGESIRSAVLKLSDKDLSHYTWFGFWDADLATPFFELENMLKYEKIYSSPAKSIQGIFGSRVIRLGSNIQRTFHRKLLGLLFKQVVEILLKVRSYDTQCGAKLFHTSIVREVFLEPFISRWVFDLELIMRTRDHYTVEYPLIEWIDVPGSKLKIFREAFRIASDIYKIKRAYSQLN
ncbi:MAG: glycosyltransferase [Bacteriovoracaceae bacterium]|nr:glycosyltransferase [Bacteriovoracaceae bacterium]